jgi:prolyl oligopeptidase
LEITGVSRIERPAVLGSRRRPIDIEVYDLARFHQAARFLVAAAIFTGAFMTGHASEEDPHLWLEEVEAEKALDWVRAHNEKAVSHLTSNSRFKEYEAVAAELLNATDRIAYPRLRGGEVYNFWQDQSHVRGVWRRSTLVSYKSENPEWETLLDVDALAETEDENWVYKGVTCLQPDYDRCMVEVSRGGSDASIECEFDMASKRFVEDGFMVPEAKSGLAWLDRDTLLVRSDFGAGSLTTSGYGRIVKRWTRGTPLDEAETIFEGKVDDVGAFPFSLLAGDHVVGGFVNSPTFFSREYFLLNGADVRRVPGPAKMSLQSVFKDRLLVTLEEDWEVAGTTYKSGALLSMSFSGVFEKGAAEDIQIVFEPDAKTSIESVGTSKTHVYVALLSNVTGKALAFDYEDGAWSSIGLALPENGAVTLVSADQTSNEAVFSYEGFLSPSTLYLAEEGGAKISALKAMPAKFDADGLNVEQLEATSKDGTKIPYFLVGPKDLTLNGVNPTILYGYGGFQVSQTPRYSTTLGNLWLEKGGVYLLANIRGGGEFGPHWHQAALKHNRQRSFDDFAAVSEDAIARGITSPKHLGVMGGSNGGLLVGVAFTQRPDLYNAVVCQVPLLDMIRYSQLLAGASWMGEYGDPSIPEDREVLLSYSPYHNVKADVDYPKVYFYTSTKDDRVHPAHARKMVARMEELGHDVLYYEHIEGGHGGGSNLNQHARRIALEYVYLAEQLGLGE